MTWIKKTGTRIPVSCRGVSPRIVPEVLASRPFCRYGYEHVCKRLSLSKGAPWGSLVTVSPRVSVVIPVYNKWALTRDCLQSLAKAGAVAALEVLVVDNASADATANECLPLGRELFGERFRLLRQERNVNFGPACNIGAQEAAGEHVFFLNNDTLVRPGWLGPLLKAFRDDPRLGAVGPLLTYPVTGRVQHLGVTFTPQLKPVHLFEHFPADHPVVRPGRRLQAVTAAALMIPRRLFLELGGFHEGFVNGFEDVDLCCRLRRAGWRMGCEPGARIVHLASQTPGRFRAEDANHALLTQRCGDYFSPDMHKHAGREGYELRLNEWLMGYAALPERREAELDALHGEETNALALHELLQREPLWRLGYDRLAAVLAAQGEWEAAVYAAWLRAYFFPFVDTAAGLRDIAQQAGIEEQTKECEAKLSIMREEAADREWLAQRARAMLVEAKKNREPELAAAFERWLREYGQPA